MGQARINESLLNSYSLSPEFSLLSDGWELWPHCKDGKTGGLEKGMTLDIKMFSDAGSGVRSPVGSRGWCVAPILLELVLP